MPAVTQIRRFDSASTFQQFPRYLTPSTVNYSGLGDSLRRNFARNRIGQYRYIQQIELTTYAQLSVTINTRITNILKLL